MSLVVWEAWVTLNNLKMWFRVGILGHVVSAWLLEGLETEQSTIPMWWSLNKNSGNQAFLMSLVIAGKSNAVYDSNESGQLVALCLELSWTLPYASLPLADIIYILSLVINHNCKYKSIQWVLCVFLANYWISRWSWGPLSLQLVSEVKVLWTLLTLHHYVFGQRNSHFYLGAHLLILESPHSHLLKGSQIVEE